MKISASYLLIPALLLTSGCATHVSGGHHYRHHGHVSVGVHGHSSGAAVVGALIVGGIVGSLVADAKNKEEAEQLKAQQLESQREKTPQDSRSDSGLRKAVATAKRQSQNSQDELVNGYTIDSPAEDEAYETALSSNQPKVQWYQYGKDGNCYLMGVDKGVTDVISAVPATKCQ